MLSHLFRVIQLQGKINRYAYHINWIFNVFNRKKETTSWQKLIKQQWWTNVYQQQYRANISLQNPVIAGHTPFLTPVVLLMRVHDCTCLLISFTRYVTFKEISTGLLLRQLTHILRQHIFYNGHLIMMTSVKLAMGGFNLRILKLMV